MIETAVFGTNKADIAPVTTTPLLTVKLLTGNFLNTTQAQMTITDFQNPGGVTRSESLNQSQPSAIAQIYKASRDRERLLCSQPFPP